MPTPPAPVAQTEPTTFTVSDDARQTLDPLFTLILPGAGIDVARKLDGTGYVVACTDHVANEWQETHATLALALARVAVLQRCAETGWDRGFAHVDADAFAPAAAHFLEGATTT